jgi:glycosyltransferase involved in cell wall biosynthesis
MDVAIPASPASPMSATDPAALISAARAAMERGDWALAVDNFLRIDGPTRRVTAEAAYCLHKLGRYAEAEKISLEALGPQRDLIALKSTPPPEDAIRRKWPAGAPPLVSIVCPAYNHERYIETAIRGFLTQQTTFPFEILIHDDASTDRTAEIICSWQERYPSIIRSILQTENQLSRGVRALDVLLPQCRGRYVAGCEGDDYWIEPSKLQKQVAFLEKNPDFSCSAHNYYLYTEADLSVRPWIASRRDLALSPRQVMNLTRLLWLPTLVFRKTFTAFPPERAFAATSDFVLTSYLGTFGHCAYHETFLGSVRRENQYSFWTPLAQEKKDFMRVKTWVALVRMHENLGNHDVASDLLQKIRSNRLRGADKAALLHESLALLKRQPEPVLHE